MPTVTVSSLSLTSTLSDSSASHDIIAFSLNLAGTAEGLYPLADIVDDAQLALLRASGHKLKVWGSVLVPETIWSARINDAAMARSITTIPFDNGSGSDYSLVTELQEVWVGTSAGANDVGRLRIKSISSSDGGLTGTLEVNYHPHILADDQYLTFKFDYPIRQKFPYIEEDGTFKKDRDVEYSDQNEEPTPVVICGQDRAKWLDPTIGSVQFTVDSSLSYATAPGASISSYGVVVRPATGSSVSFNSATGKGTITFTTTGHRWVGFYVYDSNGKFEGSWRNYWAHDPDPTAGEHPMFEFTGLRLNGEWTRGGWSTFFSVHNSATLSDIPDETSILIWADWEYGSNAQAITLFPRPNTETLLNGFITRDTTNQDYKTGAGMVDFEVHTPQEMLRRFNFSVSLEVVEGVPDTWWKYDKSLTIGRAIHHLWKEHSTILQRVDVIGLMDNTLPRGYSEFEEGDLYSMADGFAYQRGIRAHVVCDMAGRIHLTHDLQLLTDTERGQKKIAFEITQDDISGILELRREPIGRVAFVKTSGFAWDGTSFITDANDQVVPDVEPLCASAPGLMPADEGETAYLFDRQTFSDQTHANEIAGRVFAEQNLEYPSVPITFHGNYLGVFDIAYEHFYTMSLQATDTPRGVIWTDKKLICRSVSTLVDTGKGSVTVNANFEAEQDADPGVPAYCLDEIPDYGGELPPIDDDDAPDALITGGTGSSIFFKPGPVKAWNKRSTDPVNDLIQDPWWPSRTGTTASNDAILFRCGSGTIDRSIDGGQNWTSVTPSTDPPNTAGDGSPPTVSQLEFISMDGNWLYQGEFMALANWQNGSGDWRSWIAYTMDDGSTWSWKYLGGGGTSACTNPSHTKYDFGAISSGFTLMELTSNKYVASYLIAGFLYTKIVEINPSRLEITYGTATQVDEVGPGSPRMVYISSSKYAIIDRNINASTLGINCYICTVAGTTITPGPANQVLTNIEQLRGIAFPNECQGICSDGVNLILFFSSIRQIQANCQIGTQYDHLLLRGVISGTTVTFDRSLTPCDTGIQQYEVSDWTVLHADVGPNGYISKVVDCGDSFHWVLGYKVNLVSDESLYVVAGNGLNFGTASKFADTTGLLDELIILKHERLTNSTSVMLFRLFEYGYPNPDVDTVQAMIIDRTGNTATANTVNDIWELPSGKRIDNVDLAIMTSLTFTVLIQPSFGASCIAAFICQISGGGSTITVTDQCTNYWELYSGWSIYTYTPYNFLSFREIDFSGTDDPYMTTFPFASINDCINTGSGGVKGMGLSFGKGAGDRVYVTVGDDTNLELLDLTLPGLFVYDRYPLGATTWAQMATNQYLAYPFGEWGSDDWVVIYGRMNNPFSLGDPAYVIESLVGGATADLIQPDDTWTDGYCGALWVETDGLMYAIRNANGQAKLYYGNFVINLNLMSTLPFSAGVNPHAIKVDPFDLAVYAAPDTPSAIMVVKSFPLYSNWIDMTYDHGTTGDVRSLELL